MGLFKKKCKTFRCPNLHTNLGGLCDSCQARRSAAYMRNPVNPPSRVESRQSATKRGYDHSWHKFAGDFLNRHPVCAICGKPAQCVDHKTIPAEIMIDMHGKFDLNPDLYQSLCYSCNRRKETKDRAQVEKYFKEKAKLTAHPQGEGSKLFPHT